MTIDKKIIINKYYNINPDSSSSDSMRLELIPLTDGTLQKYLNDLW